MKSAISTFHKAKENDLAMDVSNFFGEINIHILLSMKTEESVA